jgi:hypothetical protein
MAGWINFSFLSEDMERCIGRNPSDPAEVCEWRESCGRFLQVTLDGGKRAIPPTQLCRNNVIHFVPISWRAPRPRKVG